MAQNHGSDSVGKRVQDLTSQLFRENPAARSPAVTKNQHWHISVAVELQLRSLQGNGDTEVVA